MIVEQTAAGKPTRATLSGNVWPGPMRPGSATKIQGRDVITPTIKTAEKCGYCGKRDPQHGLLQSMGGQTFCAHRKGANHSSVCEERLTGRLRVPHISEHVDLAGCAA